jgi:pentatricopeptide repeat-containing protein PET309
MASGVRATTPSVLGCASTLVHWYAAVTTIGRKFCSLTSPIDRDRLFMWNEIVPQRSSAFRSAISSFFSLPRFSRSISTPLAAFIRYASTSATSNPSLQATHEPLHYLRHENLSTAHFDPEDGWVAYTTLRQSDRLGDLSWKQLMSFGERIIELVESVDNGADTEPPRQWGIRLSDLLQELQLRKVGNPKSMRERILAARASALRGDINGALKQARSLWPTDKQALVPVRAIYSSCFVAAWRRAGVPDALDFMDAHWKHFKAAALDRPRVQEAEEVKTMRKHIRNLAILIDDPVTLLSEHAELWDAKRLEKTGRILLHELCRQERVDEAVALGGFLQGKGLIMPLATRCTLAQALAASDVPKANEMFQAITEGATAEDLESEAYLMAGLDISAAQGDEETAQRFFSQLPSPSMSAKVLLMRASADGGNITEVVRLFDQWFSPGQDGEPALHAPNVTHYSIVIYAHTQAEDFEGMNQWLARMSEDGIRADRPVYEIVLRSFAMRGDAESVAAIFDQMRQARIKPSVVSYTTVMRLLANQRQVAAVESLYERALREGIKPDRFMLTTLMNAHVEAGSWSGVIRVFDYFQASNIKLTIEIYNTLLKAYVLMGTPFRVVSLVSRRLRDHNIKPDERTYALLIQSACDTNLMDMARELFYEMDDLAQTRQYDITVNVYVMTMIMAGYLRNREVDKATKVFDDMQERGITPTSVTYTGILRTYANTRSAESLKLAEDFMKELLENEDRRKQWLKASFGRSTSYEVLLSPLAAAYAKSKTRVAEVEGLVQQHIDSGEPPSIQMLAFLLDTYRRTFNMAGVDRIWPQLVELGIRIGRVKELFGKTDKRGELAESHVLAVPLSLYIDAQSIAGAHEKVAESWQMLKSRGFDFTSHNWNHLCVCLIRAGEVERAFEVIERVILPYHRQTRNLIRERPRTPNSPLLTRPEPVDGDVSHLSTEPPLHRALGRVQATRMAEERLNLWFEPNSELENDLAHPLHVLHQVSPTWNLWTPHRSTLDALLSAFQRLSKGRPVRPWPRREANDSRLWEEPADYEASEAEATQAKELLARVRYQYPRAVHLVRQHEESIARTLSGRKQRRRNRKELGPRQDSSTWVFTLQH